MHLSETTKYILKNNLFCKLTHGSYIRISKEPYMEIKGFKKVTYEQLQSELHKKSADKDKSHIQIAVDIDIKSVNTIKNAFETEKQIVSDQVLTNVMNAYDLDGFVLWGNGERNYYLSTKN